jgi:four helix bundle protein
MKRDLKERTKEFALNIIGLYSQLPKRREAQVLGDQLLRSGTSVGAHFREAQRAKSNPDFISKIEGGMQELEETVYWAGAAGRSKILRTRSIGAFDKRGGPIDGDFRNDCT